MAEPIIASAVALPEAEESPLPPPKPTLKRRQSSVSAANNKRPRLSMEASTTLQDDTSKPPSVASLTTPIERRKGGVAEERTRNKRMFGGLLGHLAQASPSSAQRRRADIDQKQQAKLKLQAEEREEEKRKKREEVLVMRRREQRVYDRQAVCLEDPRIKYECAANRLQMRTRHDNLLNVAKFLKTKCEPVLFYKPWELQPADEEQIKSQVEEARATIDRELKEFAIRAGFNDEPAKDDIPRKSTSEDQRVQEGPEQAPRNPDTVGSETNNDATTMSMQGDSTNSHSVSPPKTVHTHQEPAKGHEDDHGGEVMVEDQEDTVIY